MPFHGRHVTGPTVRNSIQSDETTPCIFLIVLNRHGHKAIYCGNMSNTKHDQFFFVLVNMQFVAKIHGCVWIGLICSAFADGNVD